jgi:hypothetical protein
LAKAQVLKKLDIKWTQGIALEFDEEQLRAGGSAAAIPFNRLITEIDNALRAVGRRVWLILDRLDEIVFGDEERENLVLKGLLLAFRDVCDFPNTRVKIFLRDDVYDRVTSVGHFPALTHVRNKADHNEETLRQVLGDQWENLLPRLQRVGFLYRRFRKGIQVWTIPFLYSFALDVTREAAFELDSNFDEEEDVESYQV